MCVDHRTRGREWQASSVEPRRGVVTAWLMNWVGSRRRRRCLEATCTGACASIVVAVQNYFSKCMRTDGRRQFWRVWVRCLLDRASGFILAPTRTWIILRHVYACAVSFCEKANLTESSRPSWQLTIQRCRQNAGCYS